MPEYQRSSIIITTTTATSTTTNEVAAGDALQPYADAGEVVPVDEVKMEAEEHLAREYVQEFVLDHLDPGEVKREAAAAAAAALANDKVKPLLTALVRPPDNNNTTKGGLVHALPVEAQQMRLGTPPGTGHPNGMAGTLGPLTPPAHELEQPHVLPLYGQPPGAVQVQHVVQAGVLVKLPYGPGLTSLSHPGTPPDTPPVSTSPPALQHLQRLERLERMQLHQQHPQHQPHQHHNQHQQQPEAILPDGMPWLTQNLRQEPLDLRPHCPQEPGSEPEVESDHWPPHHLPDLVQHHHHHHHHHPNAGHPADHPGRHPRHTGQFSSLNEFVLSRMI